jgi:hypothetical protein
MRAALDEDLERVQGVRGPASSLTAGQLAQHGVPTLAALLVDVGRGLSSTSS